MPYPCGSYTFPDSVHHQCLEITWTVASCFADIDDAARGVISAWVWILAIFIPEEVDGDGGNVDPHIDQSEQQ